VTLSRLFVAVALATLPAVAHAQLNLTVDDYGLSFGNSAGVNGLRFNFRDSRLEHVNGINTTIWLPKGGAKGVVNGIALGLPATGAADVNGLAVGLGLGISHSMNGLLVAPAAGVGGNATGITVALAFGAGQRVAGLNVGALAIAGGQQVWGLTIGGLVAASGGQLVGVDIGGLGAVAGGSATGLLVGGLVAAAPVLHGVEVGGAAVGGVDIKGGMLAGLYSRIENGQLTGGSVAAVNDVRGQLHGVSIGIFNYARELHGLQFGLLNLAGNNHGLARLLPIANAHF
jgi:hypothetical protein